MSTGHVFIAQAASRLSSKGVPSLSSALFAGVSFIGFSAVRFDRATRQSRSISAFGVHVGLVASVVSSASAVLLSWLSIATDRHSGLEFSPQVRVPR